MYIESLKELDLNPDMVAKFQFPEMSPLTSRTPIVNSTLSHKRVIPTYGIHVRESLMELIMNPDMVAKFSINWRP